MASDQELYNAVIDFILESGKRISKKAGTITDIGVTKQYVTEEDLKIEQDFKKLIQTIDRSHVVFGEEENFVFEDAMDVWIIDPISGTRAFIEDTGRFSIVVSHMHASSIQFAAIYDPLAEELFTAYRGNGAFLNDKKISLSKESKKVILQVSSGWKRSSTVKSVKDALAEFALEQNAHSFAVNYAAVAAGRCDAVVSLGKDVFTEFAGSLLLQEAGGTLSTIAGDTRIRITDRVFVGGNSRVHKNILDALKDVTFVETN